MKSSIRALPFIRDCGTSCWIQSDTFTRLWTNITGKLKQLSWTAQSWTWIFSLVTRTLNDFQKNHRMTEMTELLENPSLGTRTILTRARKSAVKRRSEYCCSPMMQTIARKLKLMDSLLFRCEIMSSLWLRLLFCRTNYVSRSMEASIAANRNSHLIWHLFRFTMELRTVNCIKDHLPLRVKTI